MTGLLIVAADGKVIRGTAREIPRRWHDSSAFLAPDRIPRTP